jgi:hypothetical protein
MKNGIIFIIMVCFSFSQFEAGKKAVGGEVSTFTSDITTWTLGNDEIKYLDTVIGLNSTGSYFLIDNLAVSIGLEYTLNNQSWECNNEECSDDWFGVGNTSDVVSPFGFNIGAQYYKGNSYAHASYNDPSSEDEDDSYLAFGGGYMLELASGIYLDTAVEYRHSLSSTAQIPNNSPTLGTPIGDILNASDTESTNLKLYGSIGVTVVF